MMHATEPAGEEGANFNSYLDLYNDILIFEEQYSENVLRNFYDPIDRRFYPTMPARREESKHLNLSSTAVCTFALSRYLDYWKHVREANQQPEWVECERRKREAASRSEGKSPSEYHFSELESHFSYVVESLCQCAVRARLGRTGFSTCGDQRWPIEFEEYLIDEFSILNILYMIVLMYPTVEKERAERFRQQNPGATPPNKGIEGMSPNYPELQKLINSLCYVYLFDDQYPIEENQHPLVFYRFLCVLDYWCREKKWYSGENLFDLAFKRFYKIAKREMYRQIALHESRDQTLFDVKRLIYSFLIVTMKDTYTNVKIKDEVLRIIFEEQQGTGLWQTGHVVKPVFNIEKLCANISLSKPSGKVNLITLTSSPILSSIECLNDMLMHRHVREYLGYYHREMNNTCDWIMIRLKKDETEGRVEGWIPEYDGSHTAKAWFAAHCLIYLKNYEQLVHTLIEKQVFRDLDVVEPKFLKAKEWDDLRDSYSYKKHIEKMFGHKDGELIIETVNDRCYNVSNPEYRSALLYGPAGAGKYMIARSVARRLGWNYVEIPPGMFLEKGEKMIIEMINNTFDRLKMLSETVIFFDDVDQLVQSRDKERKNEWVVTSFIPQIIKLQSKKDLKIFLATNDRDGVDSSLMSRGKIDSVLPVGAVSWRGRLRMLVKIAEKNKAPLRELADLKNLMEDKSPGSDLRLREQIRKDGNMEKIRRYLIRSNFVPGSTIEREILKFLELPPADWEKYGPYLLFFEDCRNPDNDEFKSFENPLYREFHNWKAVSYMSAPPVKHARRVDISILNDNVYCEDLFDLEDLKEFDVDLFFAKMSTEKSKKVIKDYGYIIQFMSPEMYALWDKNMTPGMDKEELKKMVLCELNLLVMGKPLCDNIKVVGERKGLKLGRKVAAVAQDGGSALADQDRRCNCEKLLERTSGQPKAQPYDWKRACYNKCILKNRLKPEN